MRKRVIIFGGTGQVGSPLVEYLSGLDSIEVHLVSRKRRENANSLPKVHLHYFGFDETDKLCSILAQGGIAVFLIGGDNCYDREEFFSKNVQPLKQFIDASRSLVSPPPLIYFSSVYALFPQSLYGASKLEAETLIHDSYRGPWVILRPCWIISHYDRFCRLIVDGLDKRSFFVLPRTSLFDYIYYKDLARIISSLIVSENFHYNKKTLTIGAGDARDLIGFYKAFAKEKGKRIMILPIPLAPISKLLNLSFHILGYPCEGTIDKFKSQRFYRVFTDVKFKEKYQFNPTPFEQVAQDIINWRPKGANLL